MPTGAAFWEHRTQVPGACPQTATPVALADVRADIGSTEVLRENKARISIRILSNTKRAMTLDAEDHLQTLRGPARAIAMMMLTDVAT